MGVVRLVRGSCGKFRPSENGLVERSTAFTHTAPHRDLVFFERPSASWAHLCGVLKHPEPRRMCGFLKYNKFVFFFVGPSSLTQNLHELHTYIYIYIYMYIEIAFIA